MEIRLDLDGSITCSIHGILFDSNRNWHMGKVTNIVANHMQELHPRQWVKQSGDLLRGKYIGYSDHH